MVQADSVKKKIVVLGGPTGIGKSDLAVEIALLFSGEVIGADSMQIYRGADIGTGKIAASDMRGVPHHLIGFLPPDADYSVGRYAADAAAAIEDVSGRGKLPVIVGGTGLYLSAIVGGLDFPSGAESNTREKWKMIVEKDGPAEAYEYLKSIDPASAEKISPADAKRIIRAIEIFEATGRPKSEAATRRECPYDYYFAVLWCEREQLYEKINTRVDRMFGDGLLDEARSLAAYAGCNSMQAIGYKQIFEAGEGADVAALKERIKQLSRNYAKRQMTYLRGMKAVKHDFRPNEKERLFAEIEAFLRN